MNNLKRFTVCKLVNHDWKKVQYPSDDGDAGYFLRCLRCGKEDHNVGIGARGGGGMIA